MLRKKSIEDSDFLSSCLATKGHRHQLTTMGAVVPMRNMTPLSVAVRAGDDGSPPAWSCSEMTVKDKHPARPDL